MTSTSSQKQNAKSAYCPYVPAVEQACRVLIALGGGNNPGLNLTEICQQVGIHKSKGHNILNTLTKYGLVNKDPRTKTYCLGVGLLSLSRSVLDNLGLAEVAGPHLAKLAKDTGSTAFLGVASGDQFFVVAKDASDLDFGLNISVGRQFELTLGAHGKAIAAHLNPEEREEMLSHKNLYFYGDPKKTDGRMEELREELRECLKINFAKDAGEVQPGLNAVSSPVFAFPKSLIGAVVAIGTFAPDLMPAYGKKAVQAARRISLGLGAEIEPESQK